MPSQCRGKLAFPHCATLEQKFAVFCAMRTLKFACRNAYFLQLSKIIVPFTTADRNVSAPGGAQCRFGADTAKNKPENKKPGVKRRASPSTA
jgi:hypothetical protein